MATVNMPDPDDVEQDAATTTGPHAATVAEELAAMRKLHAAVEGLDRDAQVRVLTWLTNRYQVTGGAL